jgi:hypothetical protein
VPSRPLADLVHLTRTGGFMGSTTEVAVSRRGRVRLRVLQGDRTVHLTAAELERLRCALDVTRPDRLASQDQPPHPDGFVYVLAFRGRRVRLVDVASLDDLTGTVLAFLSQLADAEAGIERTVRLPPCRDS